MKIEAKDNRIFLEAIQNESHRFVTEKQIEEWSTPRDFITSEYIDDLNEFKKAGFHSFECEGGEGTPIVGGFRGFSIIEVDECFGTQVAFSTVRPEIFVRTLEDDDWGKWVKIWTSKSLKVSKSNTVLGIKPYLPVRPVKGDGYVLNMKSDLYKNINEELPIELYRFKSFSRSNYSFLVGDLDLKVTKNGNEIDLTTRVGNSEGMNYFIPLYKTEILITGRIQLISKENLITIKGAVHNGNTKAYIETYTNYEYINTIPVNLMLRNGNYYCIVSFSDNVKKISVKLSSINDGTTIRAIQVFGFSQTLPKLNDIIYRFDTDAGWQMEKISGDAVYFKSSDYHLKRIEKEFEKVFTVNIPRIEYIGTSDDGNIYIKPIYTDRVLFVRLFVKKKKAKTITMGQNFPPMRSRANARYTERTKKLKDCIHPEILSRWALNKKDILPYSFQDIYDCAFKTYPDGTIKRTNSLKMGYWGGFRDIKRTYADIAMCFECKVNGVYINGEMTYFRVQGEGLRIK